MSGRAKTAALFAAAIAATGCFDTETPAVPAPVADAGTDASAQSAGAEQQFCATRPALQFCEDFDEGPLPGRFTTISSETSFALDPANARSLPNSVKVTADASRGPRASARLEKSFPAGKKLRGFAIVRADARSANDGGSIQLMAMRFRLADGGRYEIAVVSDEKGGYAADETRFAPNEGAADSTHRFAAGRGLEAGAWTSIRFEVDFDGQGGGKLSVRFGADAAVDAVKLTPPVEPLAPTFVLGLDGPAPTTAWSVNFDTVTFSVD